MGRVDESGGELVSWLCTCFCCLWLEAAEACASRRASSFAIVLQAHTVGVHRDGTSHDRCGNISSPGHCPKHTAQLHGSTAWECMRTSSNQVVGSNRIWIQPKFVTLQGFILAHDTDHQIGLQLARRLRTSTHWRHVGCGSLLHAWTVIDPTTRHATLASATVATGAAPVSLHQAGVESPQGGLHLQPLHLVQFEPVHGLAQSIGRDSQIGLQAVALGNERRRRTTVLHHNTTDCPPALTMRATCLLALTSSMHESDASGATEDLHLTAVVVPRRRTRVQAPTTATGRASQVFGIF